MTHGNAQAAIGGQLKAVPSPAFLDRMAAIIATLSEAEHRLAQFRGRLVGQPGDTAANGSMAGDLRNQIDEAHATALRISEMVMQIDNLF